MNRHIPIRNVASGMRLTVLCCACALALGCSREPPTPEVATPARTPAAKVTPLPTPVAPDANANRMDCIGADGIRMAIDFNGMDARAFEYASSNPADRSVVCRYVASDGDETSTWLRAADGKLTVTVATAGAAGTAKFVLAPAANGWRVQIVAQPTGGECVSTPPPQLLELTGRPGEACTIAAQGGIAAFANAGAERQGAFCASKRADTAQPPTRTLDPAALFRELPDEIVGMLAAGRETVLATGSARLKQLDPAAGYLSVERRMEVLENRADAYGYQMGTYRDSAGRTVIALVTETLTGVEQGIWRADDKGWTRLGCDLVDDYREDHQYIPVAEGKALEVFNPYGQSQGRLQWNGDRFAGKGSAKAPR